MNIFDDLDKIQEKFSMDSKAPSTDNTKQRSYEAFHPIANWVTEEAKTLEIHLPDFRKEQIKVQLDNLGNLKISGERHLEGDACSRFCLNFRIPKDCMFSDIQAKFMNNVLVVVLPKRTIRKSALPPQTQEQETPTKPAEKLNEHTDTAGSVKDGKAKSETNGEEKANITSRNDWQSSGSYEVEMGGYVLRLSQPRWEVVNVAVAIVMVVVAGGYAVYRLCR